LVKVFVGSTPSVVDAHRVVGGDGPVHEGIALGALGIAREILLHDAVLVPPSEDSALERWEIDIFGRNRLEHPAHLLEFSSIDLLDRKTPPSPLRAGFTRGTTPVGAGRSRTHSVLR
jgi:hypothetical protein